METLPESAVGSSDHMSFAIEMLLDRIATDAFGTTYEIFAQRLRYQVELSLLRDSDGQPRDVVVRNEACRPISKIEDRAMYLRAIDLRYKGQGNPFIRVDEAHDTILVRQDGRQKRGRPLALSLKDASRTALSTIGTAEFPHLYAARQLLGNMRFLEINPQAARDASDRFEVKTLKPDASNLSAVLAHLQEETRSESRPEGVLADIAVDLSSLIPSVAELHVHNDANARRYSFSLGFSGDLSFSSRVISDGTIRLLALLTVLNDPARQGTLCFEEPENGVHEGRIPMLIDVLRGATAIADAEPGAPLFQILVNTHSPKVMQSLRDEEIVVADMVVAIDPQAGLRATKTRMRNSVRLSADLINSTFRLVPRFVLAPRVAGSMLSALRPARRARHFILFSFTPIRAVVGWRPQVQRARRPIRGRRSRVIVGQILPAIAQRQSFTALRESTSFRAFEAQLRHALADLGCIARRD